jgi:hypothetical protein
MMRMRDWIAIFAGATLLYGSLFILANCHFSVDLRMQAQTGRFTASSNELAALEAELPPVPNSIPMPLVDPENFDPQLAVPPHMQRVSLFRTNYPLVRFARPQPIQSR